MNAFEPRQIEVVGASPVALDFLGRLGTGLGFQVVAAGAREASLVGRVVFTEDWDELSTDAVVPEVAVAPYEFSVTAQKAREEFVAASTGFALLTRTRDHLRKPAVLPGHQAEKHACLFALFALLLAVRRQRHGDPACRLFVSWERTMLYLASMPVAYVQAEGRALGRGTGERLEQIGGLMDAQDGPWFVLFHAEDQWQQFVHQVLDDPGWSKESWCQDRTLRAQNSDVVNQCLREWIGKQRRWDAFWACQQAGVPAAIPMTTNEATQFRGFDPRSDGLPVFLNGRRMQ